MGNQLTKQTYEKLMQQIRDCTPACDIRVVAENKHILFLATNVVLTQKKLIEQIRTISTDTHFSVIAQPGIEKMMSGYRDYFQKIVPWQGAYTDDMAGYIIDQFAEQLIDAYVFRGFFDDVRTQNIVRIAALLQKKIFCKVYQYQSEEEIREIKDASLLEVLMSEYSKKNKDLE